MKIPDLSESDFLIVSVKRVVVGVIVAWLLTFAVTWCFPHLRIRMLQMGEAMNVLSVLIAGLGFSAVVLTVGLQTAQTRAALQGLKDSAKAQAHARITEWPKASRGN